jgi:uncharacterized protein
VLFACESGSRGWQFPSPDSDYDVRFIYVRKENFYLSVFDRTYDLNFPITGDLDIYGWDIRKVLQLVMKSNTTPFEWLQSPIIYEEVPGFRQAFWQLCTNYFSQRSNIHHYLGIAQGALDTTMNTDEIRIKKLFYVLRPLLAAKWCLDKNSIAPMTIGPLMELLPTLLQSEIEKLIKLKATSAESFVIRINAGLHSYINDEFSRINIASKMLQKTQFETKKLEDFFLETIRRHDY